MTYRVAINEGVVGGFARPILGEITEAKKERDAKDRRSDGESQGRSPRGRFASRRRFFGSFFGRARSCYGIAHFFFRLCARAPSMNSETIFSAVARFKVMPGIKRFAIT